jgi:hypothetical protein
LLKDRKKTRRKFPQAGAYLSSSPVLSKTPGNQSSSVELLPTGAQNGSKVASSKGALFKRVAEPNSNKSGVIKGDLSATRTVRQKRRAGDHLFSSDLIWCSLTHILGYMNFACFASFAKSALVLIADDFCCRWCRSICCI